MSALLRRHGHQLLTNCSDDRELLRSTGLLDREIHASNTLRILLPFSSALRIFDAFVAVQRCPLISAHIIISSCAKQGSRIFHRKFVGTMPDIPHSSHIHVGFQRDSSRWDSSSSFNSGCIRISIGKIILLAEAFTRVSSIFNGKHVATLTYPDGSSSQS